MDIVSRKGQLKKTINISFLGTIFRETIRTDWKKRLIGGNYAAIVAASPNQSWKLFRVERRIEFTDGNVSLANIELHVR